MTIDLILLLSMMGAAVLGALTYIIIGIIPGTDETSVLAPIILVLLKVDINPLIVLSFFIAAMISLNITDSIPTALTTIPGGVMSTPLIDASKHLKEQGLTTQSLRKMTVGSLIGTVVAVFVSLIVVLFVGLINKHIDLNSFISKNGNIIFFCGAIVLSLMAKDIRKKIISLVAIVVFGVITGLLATEFNIPKVSFFLAITTGPLLYSIFLLIFPKQRKNSVVYGNMDLEIILDHDYRGNALKILTKKEAKITALASGVASLTFFLSPVGMTLLIGDVATNHVKEPNEAAFTKVTAMNGIANASYLAGVMISLVAFKFAISPAALGPGGPLFDPEIGILTKLTDANMILAIILATIISLGLVIPITLKYAEKMTLLVFKYISHEAVLALLLSLIVLIVYLDGGIIGIGLIFLVALLSGFLYKKGVSYGVLFMSLYASTFILGWFL